MQILPQERGSAYSTALLLMDTPSSRFGNKHHHHHAHGYAAPLTRLYSQATLILAGMTTRFSNGARKNKVDSGISAHRLFCLTDVVSSLLKKKSAPYSDDYDFEKEVGSL